MTPEQLQQLLDYLLSSGIPVEQAIQMVEQIGGAAPVAPANERASLGDMLFERRSGGPDVEGIGISTATDPGVGMGERASVEPAPIWGGRPPMSGPPFDLPVRPGGDTSFGGDAFGADTYMYSPTGDPGERLYEDGSIARPGMMPRWPTNFGQGPADGIANRMVAMATKALPAQAAAPAQRNAFGRNPTAVAARNRTVAKPKPSTSPKTSAGPSYRKPTSKTTFRGSLQPSKKTARIPFPRIYKD